MLEILACFVEKENRGAYAGKGRLVAFQDRCKKVFQRPAKCDLFEESALIFLKNSQEICPGGGGAVGFVRIHNATL